MTEHVYNRTIETGEWGTLHFASLDGEQWLPVNRPVADIERAQLEAAFNPPDFLPMRLATSYLDSLAARELQRQAIAERDPWIPQEEKRQTDEWLDGSRQIGEVPE